MTVAELIAALQALNAPDAEVYPIYDGGCLIEIDRAWISKGGYVILAAPWSTVYGDEDRPVDAPLQSVDRYWRPVEDS